MKMVVSQVQEELSNICWSRNLRLLSIRHLRRRSLRNGSWACVPLWKNWYVFRRWKTSPPQYVSKWYRGMAIGWRNGSLIRCQEVLFLIWYWYLTGSILLRIRCLLCFVYRVLVAVKRNWRVRRRVITVWHRCLLSRYERMRWLCVM